MKFLIADHSMVTRRAIANALRSLAPEIVESCSVDDALAACDGSVELVVTAWSTHGFDGLTLARRLRERSREVSPRIVVMSPHNERARVLEAIDAGVDAYVLRPFDPDDLRLRIEALLPAGTADGNGSEKLAA